MSQKVLILDFGSQVTQLIARRVRELNIYCEIVPFHATIDWQSEDIKAVILSGSPASVRQDNAPSVDLNKIASQCPVLGICYGAQLIAAKLGGEVSPSKHREYGNANLKQLGSDALWEEFLMKVKSGCHIVIPLPNYLRIIHVLGQQTIFL